MRKNERILNGLREKFPAAGFGLKYENAFELLTATILSAQCTDKQVNKVTKNLFRKYKGPSDLLSVPLRELEDDIRSTGFYHNKAKALRGCAKRLLNDFGGSVPGTMEELLELPGVGRKTANVVLGAVFGKEVIIVDTHVKRVSQRLGLTSSDRPETIEEELSRFLPPEGRTEVSNRLLHFGRYVCRARNPVCRGCILKEFCKTTSEGGGREEWHRKR